ncbi:MAG: tRNA preQ1(34) S-adenosylmethionine ribosyltransferase-isomerase QueA [Acidobacteria bacterium]|nr:tRNA preQ1(34) S-adenosylmethionine ribosyltransferase-isomerase QueA [Acidobacteriota bacterium]MCL5287740.1 tRNA preQ1(34) S-adenosylmethionine ribosyltransferase-isomerase QueA [Acidobacteriota bacterium]
MKLSDFDYALPANRIAQRPLTDRARARMLLMERAGEELADCVFDELPAILRGDELVVVNNTRVLPARLFGRRRGFRAEPAGKHSRDFLSAEIEVLLTRQLQPDLWEALVRPGRKMRVGEQVVFGSGELEAEVIGRGELGLRRLRFSAKSGIKQAIEQLGHTPLPPYITREDDVADRTDYQTIFARESGAVAAPTASLHFTPTVLAAMKARGAELCEITLHVGLGTFQPIHEENVEQHKMHSEAYEISAQAAEQIARARSAKRPVLAVGTTVVRALEDAAAKGVAENFGVRPGKAEAEIFIRPGHSFRVVDQLLTNFHLPKSSLLVLVAAFAGRERILRAYEHAVAHGYRFYSYGDCMLIR